MMESSKTTFLNNLGVFIRQTEQLPTFRGKTQVIRALKRINQLSALK